MNKKTRRPEPPHTPSASDRTEAGALDEDADEVDAAPEPEPQTEPETETEEPPTPKRRRTWRERRRDPSRYESTMPPRGGFGKGALFGFVLGLPATAAAVYVAARFGIGDHSVSFETTLRFAVVFAGLPALLTAAGVGRAAARAAVAKPGRGWARAARTGALTFAAASVGLALLVAVPLGGLPADPVRWLWLAPPAAVSGAIIGALIGLWAGSRGTADTRRREVAGSPAARDTDHVCETDVADNADKPSAD